MLRKIIKKYTKRVERKEEKLHTKKVKIAENLAIFRKRKLYKDIKWSKEQTEEFNAFCKEVYGKKISPRWHKLYQSINGAFDVTYVPEKLLSSVIEPRMNAFNLCVFLQNKSLLPIILESKGIKTARNYITNSKGLYYNDNRECITKDEAINIFGSLEKCIIKPTVDTGSGKGIKFLSLKNGKDIKSGLSAEQLFDEYKEDFVLQEPLTQCKEIANIYPSAINTFRITTYALDGKVFCVPTALRIGSGGSHLDNIHAGGYGVPVSDEGVLGKYAYKLGKGDCKDKIEKHPDSGIVFDGYTVPKFQELLYTAKKAHNLFMGAGIISWDIILDADYEPIILEANLIGQGYWFPQIIHGKGIFGENTKRIIELYLK